MQGMPITRALPLLGIALSSAGCTALVPERPAPAQFETPEYLAQPALKVVGAAHLYARGGTGQGQVIGVIDSGLNRDLPEFHGRVADVGHDYVRGQAGVIDSHGHGTQMAGVIAANKDGQGIHGIAYNARLIPMRFGDDNQPFFFDEAIAASWQYAFDRGAHVLSNSWANSIPATQITEARYNQVMPHSLAMARKLVSAGAVLVFPTGNELRREPLAEAGLPRALPELEKGWLAVVALDAKGSAINGSANYCGIAAPWCIAVPGGDSAPTMGLLTTSNDGGYTQTAGTSPAAALVAGALAALQSRYPEQSAQQIRQLLLDSANRSGVFANSEAYGRGLMDLEKASRAKSTLVAK